MAVPVTKRPQGFIHIQEMTHIPDHRRAWPIRKTHERGPGSRSMCCGLKTADLTRYGARLPMTCEGINDDKEATANHQPYSHKIGIINMSNIRTFIYHQLYIILILVL